MSTVKSILCNISDFFTIHEYDIDQIMKDVREGKLTTGSRISVEGKLLRYAQIFKPYSNVHSLGTRCTMEHEKKFIYGKGLVKGKAMKIELDKFQYPVQKLPNNGNVGCAFLYDSRFRGFEFDEITNDDQEVCYKVNEYAKPIMVLYDTLKQDQYVNKRVAIKGEIVKIPYEIIDRLKYIDDITIQEICSNFIDPLAEENDFLCLTTLTNRTSIEVCSDIDNIEGIKGALYVENFLTNLQGQNEETIRTILEKILPNLPQKLDPKFPLTVANTVGDEGFPFLSINDISVVYRSPGTIGFYTKSSLFDSAEYREKIDDLRIFINNFRIDYMKLIMKELGINSEMNMNFLFDYKKQYLFDNKGTLYGNNVEASVVESYNLKNTRNWLRECPPTN